MSASGAEAAAPGGVVRSSALAFVASTQPSVPSADNGQSSSGAVETEMGQADMLVPAGLKALCEACTKLYPDQPNPLQVTTRLKYWLGGLDPLDYISMYWNPGKPDEHIPPHWHYVSFGLSDLHGDGRVHPPPTDEASPSGYGLELTFRLSAEGDARPPLWPAALLQALARYVFTTGNKLCPGDHITWHRPLDAARSRLRHLLVAADPLLRETRTAHGTVAFLQMVGCTGKELRAAQRGSGFEVLRQIGEDPNCGGAWLVTRPRRRASARAVRAPRAPPPPRPAPAAPAELAGVSAKVHWHAWTPGTEEETNSPSLLPESLQQQIKDTLQRGLSTMSTDRSGPEGHMSTDSFEMSSMERALPCLSHEWSAESARVWYPPGVHIVLNPEGASLLPLAIHGRVLAGSDFTWRGAARAVTVSPRPAEPGPGPGPGPAATPTGQPYVATGPWLQAVIPKDLAEDMARQVWSLTRLADSDSDSSSESEDSAPLPRGERPALPMTLVWPDHRLKITVIHDSEFL